MDSLLIIGAVFIFLTGIGIGISLIRPIVSKKLRKERSAMNNDHRRQLKSLELENKILLQEQETVLLVLNSDSSIVLANSAAHDFLNHPHQLKGKALTDYCSLPELLEVIEAGMSSNDPIKQEVLTNITHRGNVQEAFLAVHVSKVLDGAGAMLTRVAIQNITDKRLNELIHKDFVANASHELRTPLTIINGYVETLLDDPETLNDKETTHYFLNVMKRHSNRLTRIVEEMLMITKLDSGLKDILKTEPFLVQESIDECISHLDHVIKERQTDLTIDLPDPSIQIVGDRFYWSQILFNLVENAIKQNPDHPVKIQVSCRRDGQKTLISVSDNGVGIPADDIPFIFKRFYRVAKDHSQQKIKGTGLGLSIVKRAVEAHGGTISCQSHPGTQTTFLIELPAA